MELEWVRKGPSRDPMGTAPIAAWPEAFVGRQGVQKEKDRQIGPAGPSQEKTQSTCIDGQSGTV